MSGRFWLVKAGPGWLPTDDESRALHAKMGFGEMAEFTAVQPRSLRWHKMYFALCTEIGRNQDPPRDADSIDAELRILAGHYDVMHIARRPPWWLGALITILGQEGSGACEWFARRLPEYFKHHEVRVPKRIAFARMTGDEWSDYWKRAEIAIRERFGSEYLGEITLGSAA